MRQRENGAALSFLKILKRVKNKVRKTGSIVYVCSLPKTGSSYLANLLATVTGFPHADLVYRYGRNEQDIYLPRLIDNMSRDCVVQQHTRATIHNLALMREFGVKPIVHVRSIFDMIISQVDYFDSVDEPKMFMLFTDRKYHELDREQRTDMVIDLAVPWYINFYTSWESAYINKRVEMIWTSYEEMIEDRQNFMARILTFLGLESYIAQVKKGMVKAEQGRNRFNKGVVGRGEKLLTGRQRDRIRSFCQYYPWVNFERIGL